MKKSIFAIEQIGEIEKLQTELLNNFELLLEKGKNHTKCLKYNGQSCYFPANVKLLQRYIPSNELDKKISDLLKKDVITGNIDIRDDKTTVFEIKKQFINVGFLTKSITHKIVFHNSNRPVFSSLSCTIVCERKLEIIESMQIKNNWFYLITSEEHN